MPGSRRGTFEILEVSKHQIIHIRMHLYGPMTVLCVGIESADWADDATKIRGREVFHMTLLRRINSPYRPSRVTILAT
jgi:hypothetical protein